jgi:hypothetical protein
MALAVVFDFLSELNGRKRRLMCRHPLRMSSSARSGPGRSLNWEWGPAASDVKRPRIGDPLRCRKTIDVTHECQRKCRSILAVHSRRYTLPVDTLPVKIGPELPSTRCPKWVPSHPQNTTRAIKGSEPHVTRRRRVCLDGESTPGTLRSSPSRAPAPRASAHPSRSIPRPS